MCVKPPAHLVPREACQVLTAPTSKRVAGVPGVGMARFAARFLYPQVHSSRPNQRRHLPHKLDTGESPCQIPGWPVFIQ
jgi:hypothetical protein